MGPLGLEPRTNGLKVRCSNQLSYGPGEMVPQESAAANALPDGKRWSAASGAAVARRAQRLKGRPSAVAEMPERGLEPPPSYLDKNLNLARLPIPPLGQVDGRPVAGRRHRF